MICLYCKKQNRAGSKFCRSCGHDLAAEPSYEKNSSIDSHFQIRIPKKFFKTIPKFGIITPVVIIVLVGGTVYAAPKVNDYMKVRKAIQEAKEKQYNDEYQVAIDTLNSVENRWSLKSQKQELMVLKQAQVKFMEYEQIVTKSAEKENVGSFKEARNLLQSVGTDYPKYESKIKPKLAELQGKIEKGLESKADIATAAKAEAERKAQAESVARARAQADAVAANEAKTKSDAAAAAAAEQARQAEYKRQQEEAERAKQVQISFLNQLLTARNSLNDGVTYYNRAMGYYNSGDNLVALSVFGQANTAFNSAYNQASDLITTFSGLPSTYSEAANNLQLGSNACLKAVSSIISDISSDSYTGGANYYSNKCDTYRNYVTTFLNNQGY